MSADNGVYILQSLDGYRVTEAGAIGNLYWWETWTCCNNPVAIKVNGEDLCQHCGNHLPTYEQQDKMNPEELKRIFGDCKVFHTKEEALMEADKIYDEYQIVEYGIMFIKGWEDLFFPE